MKKQFTIVIFMLGLLVVLMGCGKMNEGVPQEITRVSVILPHCDDDYWSKIENGILKSNEEAKENGIDIKTYVPQLNYNVEQMTQILKQQIAEKVDVIVVQGNEDEKFMDALYHAYAQGIRIVCIDTDLPDFPEHLYIGTDNYNAGYSMGKHIIEMIGENASVTVISGEADYPNLAERAKGLERAFRTAKNIQIKETLFDNYDGLTFLKRYHESENDDTLVCIEGTGAQTLDKIFKSRDNHFKNVFGFDVTNGIPTGVIDGVLTQNNEEMGQCLVSELIHYKVNGTYSTNHIYTDTTWVTRENYEQTMDDES